jgi:hypothetical protein
MKRKRGDSGYQVNSYRWLQGRVDLNYPISATSILYKRAQTIRPAYRDQSVWENHANSEHIYGWRLPRELCSLSHGGCHSIENRSLISRTRQGTEYAQHSASLRLKLILFSFSFTGWRPSCVTRYAAYPPQIRHGHHLFNPNRH